MSGAKNESDREKAKSNNFVMMVLSNVDFFLKTRRFIGVGPGATGCLSMKQYKRCSILVFSWLNLKKNPGTSPFTLLDKASLCNYDLL